MIYWNIFMIFQKKIMKFNSPSAKKIGINTFPLKAD